MSKIKLRYAQQIVLQIVLTQKIDLQIVLTQQNDLQLDLQRKWLMCPAIFCANLTQYINRSANCTKSRSTDPYLICK